jgi:hypothetical protein
MIEIRFKKRDLDLKTFIRDYCVSTVALAIEHNGGMWYETYIFPADGKEITEWGEVWGTRYPDREAAEIGHEKVCAQLTAGKLETWDGEKL